MPVRLSFGTFRSLFNSQRAARLAFVTESQRIALTALWAQKEKVTDKLPTASGMLLHDAIHKSDSDSRPHCTIDIFDVNNVPIGTAHVFEDTNEDIEVFTEPRTGAVKDWNKAQQIGN
ncbi:uncharacterized protein STEHIDRAFT_154400 [Stereum hirsutum FP-91666 SS1]|uniref:uncharacterized protein n=1 Tax=Stereum hirsutum (strain FP-91666) TaxID=721885 RepID=UPI000440C60C|nr:uncharacterized protein STEHIDRAFT_154400 [Stereum hirsutum FP-91666 SS1]EIM88672.1 hypothetical protein STEHIDRAFT_154400 [Stereum hirsutum FP-91666 SS1]